MIITSVLGNSKRYGNDFNKNITIEVIGSDDEYFGLCEALRCNKEVSVVNKRNNDAVDALCYYAQAVKSHKDTSPIKKVIFNNPATIVLWNDGTKTVVKCQEGDTYDKEKGLALCIAKKALGNKGNFNNEFKRWVE